MTSESTVKAPKTVESHPSRYVDINEVPDLIARVMQNDFYINNMATKEAKNQPNN